MHENVVKKYKELQVAKLNVSRIERELGELVGNELDVSAEVAGKLAVRGPAPTAATVSEILDSPGGSGGGSGGAPEETTSTRYAAARRAIASGSARESGPSLARPEGRPGANGEVVSSLPHRIVELVNGNPDRVFSKKDLFEALASEFPDRIERSFGTLAHREARKGHIGKKGPGVFVAKRPARGAAKASAAAKVVAPKTTRRVKGEARA